MARLINEEVIAQMDDMAAYLITELENLRADYEAGDLIEAQTMIDYFEDILVNA